VKIRAGAIVALLFAATATVVAAAGVAAVTLADSPPAREPLASSDLRSVPHPPPIREGGGAGDSPTPTITGIASNYAGTAGWMGRATVALPGDLGGRYTGEVTGFVTVCADRCARLPVVDWCQCYWGSADQRVVDLSHAAWALVSDRPLESGLVDVRLILER